MITRISFAVALVSTSVAAHAAVFARYDFPGTTASASLASSDTDTDTTATDFLGGPGYGTLSFNGAQPGGGVTTGVSRQVNGAGVLATPVTTALANMNTHGEYFTFTVTAAPTPIDLTRFSIFAQRGAGSPDRMTVYVLPGGVVTAAVEVISNVTVLASFSPFTADLSLQPTLKSISSAEVRVVFHGSNQGSATGFNRVDAIELQGVVIPEPATLGAVVLMLAAGLGRRTR